MLINAIVLQEAKDSSEIENTITTKDELYKALTINKSHILPETIIHESLTHGILHAGFSGFRRFVTRKKSQYKLIVNRLVISHYTIKNRTI